MTMGIGPGAISIRGSIDRIGSALPRVAKRRAGGVAARRERRRADIDTWDGIDDDRSRGLARADVVMIEVGRRDARDGAWAAAPRTSAENGR